VESLLFWTFAVITLAGGVGVVVARNPVNGAMALVGSFFSLAGLFLLLDAQLIAALQVLVYAGAIMVLFLFVIMLLNLGPRDLGPPRFGVGKGIGVLAVAATVTTLLKVVLPLGRGSPVPINASFGTVESVGRVLYQQYALPFEVVSLLLLTAIVAAVVVAKGRI
jgi:NADH-quinone oxidoreductase subunit J